MLNLRYMRLAYFFAINRDCEFCFRQRNHFISVFKDPEAPLVEGTRLVGNARRKLAE